MWADAVFEGGGVKGIGLVGALCVAEEKGYSWKKLAGTSAGSIIATLLAAGYTAQEIYQLILKQDFSEFVAPSWYDRLFFCFGPTVRLWVKKGFYSGNPLEKWLEKILLAKGVRTFADLPDDKELHIIASDISRSKLLVLPQDLKEYGISLEKMSVARAVRMSCSIPFFFEPVVMPHQPTGSPSYIVDGGVLSNFPVWIFDREEPRWPTFGFRMHSNEVHRGNRIRGPLSLFWSLFFTMMEAHDNRDVQEQEEVRTIQSPTLGVRVTDFTISEEKKEALYQAGREAAEKFFDTWTFSNYLSVRGKRSLVCNIKSSNEVVKG